MPVRSTVLLFLFLVSTQLVWSQVSTQDFNALKALYKSTNGGSWTNNTGWDTTANTVSNSWHGVTVVGGRVTALNLSYSSNPAVISGNNLSGTIPDEIGQLTALNLLHLGANALTGSIPESVGLLTSLNTLSLFTNQLTGSIPTTICNLLQLNYFSLRQNQLSGEIPACIGQITNLTDIYIDHNNLTGAVPTSILNLTNLQSLVINHNKLNNLPNLTGLTNLAFLYINNNKFTFSDIEKNCKITTAFFYKPQDNFALSTDSIKACAGGIFTLHVEMGGVNNRYQWFKDGIAATGISTSPDLLISPFAASKTGSYTCVVTNTTPEISTLTLTSLPLILTEATRPLVCNLGNDTSFCRNQSVKLDAGDFFTYQWQHADSTSRFFTASESGTYTVNVQKYGCTASDQIKITVHELPILNLGKDTAICQGATITWNSGGIENTYRWQDNSTGNTFEASSAGKYYVQSTSKEGCRQSDTISLSINELPTFNIGNDTTVCPGQKVRFTSNEVYPAYQWHVTDSIKQSFTTDIPGIVKLKVTDNNGCQAIDSALVTHYSLPPLSISGKDQSCAGASETLTATTGFSSYLWQNASTNQNIQVTTSGTYQVTATDSHSCKQTASKTIAFNALPQPLLPDKTICGNGVVEWDAGVMDSYQWSVTDSIGRTLHTNQAGKYWVNVTKNGCSNSDTAIFTINPLPQIAMEDKTICDSGSYTFTPGVFPTYKWHNGSTLPSFTATISTKVWVTVTDSRGCKATDTAYLKVNPPPPLELGSNKNICRGDTVWLDAGAGMKSYVWYYTLSGILLKSGVSKFPVTATGTYSVDIADPFGCFNTDQISITVNPSPTVNLGGTRYFCSGDSILLNAQNTGSQFLWQDSSTKQTLYASEAGTYTVTVTNSSGCSKTASTRIVTFYTPTIVLEDTVRLCNGQTHEYKADTNADIVLWNGVPGTYTLTTGKEGTYYAEVRKFYNGVDYCWARDTSIMKVSTPSLSISGTTEFCADTSTTLQASLGFASYVWNTGSTDSAIEASETGTYTVSATDNLGCMANKSIVVLVNKLPKVSLGENIGLCTGEETTLTTTFEENTSYQWQDNSTGNSYQTNQGGQFILNATSTKGCSNSDTIEVVEHALPIPDLGFDTTFICDGLFKPLTAGEFASYTWQNGSHNALLNANHEGMYHVTVYNEYGCKGTDSIFLYELPIPYVEIGKDDTLCPLDSKRLNAGSQASEYLWQDGSTDKYYEAKSGATYWVTVSNLCGTYTDSVTIHAIKVPPLNIGNDTTVCYGQELLLKADSLFTKYQWSNGSRSESVKLTEAQTIWLQAYYGQCITVSNHLTVSQQSCEASPPVSPPNVFTPNGDGYNDQFIVEVENAVFYDLRIYNRWGRLVFATSEVNGPWDGLMHGNELEGGSYFWVLQYRGELGATETVRGTVMLIK